MTLSTTSLIVTWTLQKEDYEDNDLFSVMGIAQLQNPLKNKKANVKMMKEFERYWQVKVGTIKPHGMNDINE